MQLIAHQELSSSQTSIVFSSIPQNYTDLYLVLSLRGDLNNPQIGHFIRFNNDSGTSYKTRWLSSSGSSVSVASQTTETYIYSGQAPAATSTGSVFGNTSIYIPNYTSSNPKPVSIDATRENSGTAVWTAWVAGLWTGTSAINRIDIVCEASNWVAASSATLYGIKSASDGNVLVS